MGFVAACGLTLVAVSGGYSPVAVCRLQQLWHTGLVIPRYVESSQTRDQTCVSCIAGATEPPGKPLDFNFCFLPFIFSEMETESAC